jgi:ubiquinol-cytochrome c reductase cytochrome b subunit/menaquinol-cytochrome c reductase cytochrome b/c subunit
MILLFLLPFYDRSPERRIERRPVALAAGIAVIAAMAYLTYSGAHTGSPNTVEMKPPSSLSPAQKAQFTAGADVVGESGCLACHVIGENGNNGPGPPLTHIGNKLPAAAIASTLRNPTPPMPSFRDLASQQPQKFKNLVGFLSMLQ